MSESSTQANPKTYWKSLNELAQNKEYQNFVEREFPENATELNDGVSRKGFLRVMGASIALAGFAACRRPVQKILPYSQQPEDIVPWHTFVLCQCHAFSWEPCRACSRKSRGSPNQN
jgi:MoCo/4Fe-4S cofactor protein with predicted Tat translocation signal